MAISPQIGIGHTVPISSIRAQPISSKLAPQLQSISAISYLEEKLNSVVKLVQDSKLAQAGLILIAAIALPNLFPSLFSNGSLNAAMTLVTLAVKTFFFKKAADVAVQKYDIAQKQVQQFEDEHPWFSAYISPVLPPLLFFYGCYADRFSSIQGIIFIGAGSLYYVLRQRQ